MHTTDERYPGDLQFQQAAAFSKAYQGLSSQLKSEICREAADSFQLRIENVRHLGILPIDLVYWSSLIGKIKGHLCGKHGLNFDSHLKEDYALAAESEELFRTGHISADDAWVKGHTLLAKLVQPLIQNPSDDPRVRGYTADGLRSMLGAMVINSWMCLETLVEDLWISCVSAFPRNLALPVLESTSGTSRDQPQRQKSISITAFREYGFDLQACMGEILVEQRKVEFRTMAGAKDAYRIAFEGRVKALDNTKELVSFEAVRNILAHKGGEVDKKFLSLTKSDPRFANISVGEMVPLTGGISRDYSSLCVECSVSLLQEVDALISEISACP